MPDREFIEPRNKALHGFVVAHVELIDKSRQIIVNPLGFCWAWINNTRQFKIYREVDNLVINKANNFTTQDLLFNLIELKFSIKLVLRQWKTLVFLL